MTHIERKTTKQTVPTLRISFTSMSNWGKEGRRPPGPICGDEAVIEATMRKKNLMTSTLSEWNSKWYY